MMKCIPVIIVTLAAFGTSGAPAFAGDPGKVHIMSPRPMSARGMASGVRAMALINADGSIAYSKGITKVTSPQIGVYCVTLTKNIDVQTAVPVMSFNYDSSPDYSVFIVYSPVYQMQCPAHSLGIVTYSTDSGAGSMMAEGFTIIVP